MRCFATAASGDASLRKRNDSWTEELPRRNQRSMPLAFPFNIVPFACSERPRNPLARLCALARSGFGERPAVKRQKGTTDGSPGVAHHFASGLRVLAPPLPEDASATSRPFRPSAMPRPDLTRTYESRMFEDSATSSKPIAQRCRCAF